MITDLAVKKDFIVDAINKRVDAIYREQLYIAPIRSGYLYNMLRCGEREVFLSNDFDFRVTVNTPIYLRFLDMRRYGNLAIYNRIIWGQLYGDLYGKILKYLSLEQGELKLLLHNSGMGVYQSKSDEYYNVNRNSSDY